MIGVPGQNHKRSAAGVPLCGKDQLGFMWDKAEQVDCRACQLVMRHPELAADIEELTIVKELAKEVELLSLAAGGNGK